MKEIVDDFVKNSSILVWDAFKKEETTIKMYVNLMFSTNSLREFYGLLADLEAKHHMSNMKVNFSSIKHWSILCDSQRYLAILSFLIHHSREEEQSAPIDQMKKCQLKNMAVWKVSSPSELDKIYEAHGMTHRSLPALIPSISSQLPARPRFDLVGGSEPFCFRSFPSLPV